MNQVRKNPLILQAKQTSIVPSQLSDFCVTPIRSSIDKNRNFFQGFSFSKNVLASWQVLEPVGYGPSHHLQTLNSSSGQQISNPTSNFQLPSILKCIQLYCLPSFCWYQTKRWLLRLIMEFPLIHISNIIPPLYPIVIHLFLLVEYPTYRNKTHSYFAKNPLRGISFSFPWVKCPHRVLPPLKWHKLIHRPYFSYPGKRSKSSFTE